MIYSPYRNDIVHTFLATEVCDISGVFVEEVPHALGVARKETAGRCIGQANANDL